MSDAGRWQLRNDSGRVFGPISLTDLRLWAGDGRVGPDDDVSPPGGPWRAARDVPELGMDWLLELPDGGFFGPVPLDAFLDMLREGSLGSDLRVRRKDETEFRRLGDLAAAASGMAASGPPSVPASSGDSSCPDPASDATRSAPGGCVPMAVDGPGSARPVPSSPPSARSIGSPDEERMISELRTALGVGRGLGVFARLRPGRSDGK
jgi:hypothetical protein